MATILIAEDDADIRDLIVFKLEQTGHTVVAVGDGEAAVEAATNGTKPDLIMLDVMMPRLTGIEVCRRLRQEAVTAEVPIVLLTARARENDVAEGLAAGADDYIVKPFSPRELGARIKTLLSEARA